MRTLAMRIVFCVVALISATLPVITTAAQEESFARTSLIETRKSMAAELLFTFTTLDHQIPNLSPTQQNWLKSEYQEQIANSDGRYNARALAATNSVEYQIFVVKPQTKALVSTLTAIRNGTFRGRAEEVALWSSVVEHLVNFQYWQAIGNLAERGIVQKRIGHVDSLYFENYTLQASEILSSIVTPYLRGEIK